MERSRFQRITDNWDLARSRGRESDQGGLCGAQYQPGDLPRVEEEVWRDGVVACKRSLGLRGGAPYATPIAFMRPRCAKLA